MEVGVVSDTHGLVRPQLLAALKGVALILHAGDVGGQRVLDELEGVAPVQAVRGNTDRGPLRERLPHTLLVELPGANVYLVHDLYELDIDPEAAEVDLVISGHTHSPSLTREGEVLYLNPGSAGPRRFDRPVAMARLVLGPNGILVRQVDLEKV